MPVQSSPQAVGVTAGIVLSAPQASVLAHMTCATLGTAGIADAQVRLQQARGAIQGAQRQVQGGMLQRQEAAAQQRLQRVRRLRAYSPLLAQPHLKVGTPQNHQLQSSAAAGVMLQGQEAAVQSWAFCVCCLES